MCVCLLGNFACFFVVCWVFCLFVYFFKNKFQNNCQSVKQFGSRRYARPDLGPNCVQMLAADGFVLRQRVKTLLWVLQLLKMIYLRPCQLFF